MCLAPVSSLSLGVVLLRDARLAERVKTGQCLRSTVGVVADLADQKLVVNLFHQFLASRHGGSSGCLERLQGPDLGRSSGRTGCNQIQQLSRIIERNNNTEK